MFKKLAILIAKIVGTGTIFLAALAGCAPAQNSPDFVTSRDATGYKNNDGIDYTTGGDWRVAQEIENEPEPAAPAPLQTKAAVRVLRERLIAFAIQRFDKASSAPKRFGKDTYKLSVFVRQDDGSFIELKFAGHFAGTASELAIGPISPASHPEFSIQGKLIDQVDKVTGDLTLTSSKNAQVGRIFYRAYKAKMTVRTNNSPEQANANAQFATTLELLKKDAFAWVNNWVVAKGPSFYSVDVVHLYTHNTPVADAEPVLSFSGEALRTGEDVKPEHTTQVAKNKKDNFDVKLIGDAGDEGARLFEVTMKNPTKNPPKNPTKNETKSETVQEKTRVIVELEEENPAPVPEEFKTAEPVEPAPETAPETEVEVEEPEAPAPATPVTLPQGKSFFDHRPNSPLEKKIMGDMDSNLKIKGVVERIQLLTGKEFATTKLFFHNAFPFRAMIQTIGDYFDTATSYFFVAYRESVYFKSNGFRIQINSDTKATGPFQFLASTAKVDLNMNVTKSGEDPNDERRFFATSACASAQYFLMTLKYMKGEKDMTLAFLAYYQGAGNVNKWMSRMNARFDGFNFRYSDFAKYNVINLDKKNYVNEALAVYAISKDLKKYGLPLSGRKTLPASAFPPRRAKNKTCNEVVQSLKASS